MVWLFARSTASLTPITGKRIGQSAKQKVFVNFVVGMQRTVYSFAKITAESEKNAEQNAENAESVHSAARQSYRIAHTAPNICKNLPNTL